MFLNKNNFMYRQFFIVFAQIQLLYDSVTDDTNAANIRKWAALISVKNRLEEIHCMQIKINFRTPPFTHLEILLLFTRLQLAHVTDFAN